jgi:TetR/AcrR family transcriptional regulator, multidrug resistance operon repressor
MRPKSHEKEEAIRSKALEIIARDGLENLSMQKLADAAGVSPRTIYLKYENKEDLLIRLFIDHGMGAYETALLAGFDESMDFDHGIRLLWRNTFRYFSANLAVLALMQYGSSSPLLLKAFRERNIRQGQHFSPIHHFLKRHTRAGLIRPFPLDVQRAMLFAPLMELVKEHSEHRGRPRQIVTAKVLEACCEAVIEGMLLKQKTRSKIRKSNI